MRPKLLTAPIAVLTALGFATGCDDPPTSPQMRGVAARRCQGCAHRRTRRVVSTSVTRLARPRHGVSFMRQTPSAKPICLVVSRASAVRSRPIENRRATPGNLLFDDGAGAYVDGECGVAAYRTDFLWFRASAPLKGKALRNAQQCADFPRSWELALTGSTLVHDENDPGDHSLDTALQNLIDNDQADSTVGRTESDRAIRLFNVDVLLAGQTSLTTGSIVVPYCLATDGTGQPMKFNDGAAGNGAGSNLLSVTVSADGDTLQVRSQSGGNNVAWCGHGRADGSTVTLLLHVDIAHDAVTIN